MKSAFTVGYQRTMGNAIKLSAAKDPRYRAGR